MKRLLSTTVILGFAVCVFALGSMGKVLQDTYKFKSDSAAAAAKCGVCHATKMGGKLNAYGLDLKAALKGSKSLTTAVLKSVESKDSDGDGKNNGAELKAGENPGVK